MNEILNRKYVKMVSSYGIPKNTAKYIVDTAIMTAKGRNIDFFIDYAMSLKYGLKLTKKA